MVKKSKRICLSKHGQYMDKHPCSNMFIDFRRKVYHFRKKFSREIVTMKVELKEIRTERDYLDMIVEWNTLLAHKGDSRAKDWMENEKFKTMLDFKTSNEIDFDSSPRASSYYQ